MSSPTDAVERGAKLEGPGVRQKREPGVTPEVSESPRSADDCPQSVALGEEAAELALEVFIPLNLDVPIMKSAVLTDRDPGGVGHARGNKG